jgi:hypothetical protein
MAVVFGLAEIARAEQLWQADDLRALGGSSSRHRQALCQICVRVLVTAHLGEADLHRFASRSSSQRRIFGDVGDQIRIENALLIVCGIKAAIEIEIGPAAPQGTDRTGTGGWAAGAA